MLASIHPLGERARHNRWGITATAYVVASTLGGVAAGALAGLAGWPLRDVNAVVVVLAAAALVAAAVEAGLLPVRIPGPRRQVDEEWMDRYRGWVYGAGFGAQLGTGVVTIVTTPAVHLTLALALAAGSPGAGAVVGGVFGLARALPVLGLRGVHDPARLRALHRRLADGAGAVQRASAVALAAVGAVLVAYA